MRISAAGRELSRNQGAIGLPLGYTLVTRDQWNKLFRTASFPVDAYTVCRSYDGLWWLDTVPLATTTADPYVDPILDNPGSTLMTLSAATYSFAIGVKCAP